MVERPLHVLVLGDQHAVEQIGIGPRPLTPLAALTPLVRFPDPFRGRPQPPGHVRLRVRLEFGKPGVAQLHGQPDHRRATRFRLAGHLGHGGKCDAVDIGRDGVGHPALSRGEVGTGLADALWDRAWNDRYNISYG